MILSYIAAPDSRRFTPHRRIRFFDITVGRPKWPLGYTPVYMNEAAPFGLLQIADNDEFSKRYRDRLDAIGIEAFSVASVRSPPLVMDAGWCSCASSLSTRFATAAYSRPGTRSRPASTFRNSLPSPCPGIGVLLATDYDDSVSKGKPKPDDDKIGVRGERRRSTRKRSTTKKRSSAKRSAKKR